MFLEKIFGNVFGVIWLIIFLLSIGSLLAFVMLKKKDEQVIKEYHKETYKEYSIEENEDGKYDVKKEETLLKTFDSIEDCKVFVDVVELRNYESTSIYEIVEEEGFFKVKKKDTQRTIRKFSDKIDAENYIKEKENNDWSKTDR